MICSVNRMIVSTLMMFCTVVDAMKLVTVRLFMNLSVIRCFSSVP